jgi:hypothetical protein
VNGRALVAVGLAALLGLAPLLQGLHVVTASHGHRFCADHQRVEDVPRAPRLATYARAAGTDGAALRIDGVDTPSEQHLACAVLNSASGRDPACLAQSSGPGDAATLRVPCLGAPRTAPVRSPLLAAARKHSPPVVFG